MSSDITLDVAGTPQRNGLGAEVARPTHKAPALTVRSLPAYSRSLLRISVPAMVVLAQKRQSLGRIVEFGPGAIIQFEKSCDEMLELHVGGKPIAMGEAVKVGDKFGLRITSMVLPGERFEKVVPRDRNTAS